MFDTQKTPSKRPVRYDHSFVARRLVIYSKPALALIRRHFERLDSSFLRLSNDYIWMNDEKSIASMMKERSEIITGFEVEIDDILNAYTAQLKKYSVPIPTFDQLKPVETMDLNLHSSTSLEALRLFEKLDRIFLLLEAMKQNGLVDELAFIHACNAWKTSTGEFAKAVHALRIRRMAQSKDRTSEKTSIPTTKP